MILNIEEIKKLIPHREPFLFINTALQLLVPASMVKIYLFIFNNIYLVKYKDFIVVCKFIYK